MGFARELKTAYLLRWKRRRLLFRALRKRHELRAVRNRTSCIGKRDILLFSTVRNEAVRLPHFLTYYRRLGVDHFLFVDNGSDDGTHEYLAGQEDVSLWTSEHSYRQSRFGMDWLTWLQIRFGHGHWCVTVDADEILIYPFHDSRPLSELTAWLDMQRQQSFGAIMIDMYPKGRLSENAYTPGDDPFEGLCWYDAGNYVWTYQQKIRNPSAQGGARARAFFAHIPRRAPTMSKKPLVKWNRRYAYLNSTHSVLPRRLNDVHDQSGRLTSGILLHSKFLPSVIERSRVEKERKEHFAVSSIYDDYYDAVIADPVLWTEDSVRYSGWRQFEDLGLMSRGGWA